MDIAHVSGSGSCPVFREELWRLRAGTEVSASQPRERKGRPGPPDADFQGEGGRSLAH